jgi:CRP/FNR family transcriptional regulator, cyclic AMP receptor protein
VLIGERRYAGRGGSPNCGTGSPFIRSRDPGLRDCPLFAGLPADEILALEGSARRVKRPSGSLLLEAGDPAEHVWVLVRGAVRLLIGGPDGEQLTLQLVSAPAVVGDLEALTSGTRLVAVEVVRPSELIGIDRSVFESLLDRHPRICRRLLTDAYARLRAASLHQGQLAFESVDARLAALLLSYSEVFGTKTAEGMQLVVEGLTQTGLARDVGANTKSVQRAFVKWTKSGLIKKNGRYLVLPSPAELEKVAGEGCIRIHYRMRALESVQHLPARRVV